MCDAWEDVEAAVLCTEDLKYPRIYRDFDGIRYFKVAACAGSTWQALYFTVRHPGTIHTGKGEAFSVIRASRQLHHLPQISNWN